MRKRTSIIYAVLTAVLLLSGIIIKPAYTCAYEYTGGTKPAPESITISADPSGAWNENKTFSNDSDNFKVNSPLAGKTYTVGEKISLSVTSLRYFYTVLPGGIKSSVANNIVMTILKEDSVKKTFRVNYYNDEIGKTFTDSFTPIEEGTYKINIFYRGSSYSGSNYGNYTIQVKKGTSGGKAEIGSTKTVSGQTYKVLSDSSLAFTSAANKASVTVPNTVKINGDTYKVTQIVKTAFKGKKNKTVTIGKNVTKISQDAFSGSKVTKIILKTKKLTKKSVKNSLRGSAVKTVQVKVNKNTLKKYKKIFVKSVVGKKVTVK